MKNAGPHMQYVHGQCTWTKVSHAMHMGNACEWCTLLYMLWVQLVDYIQMSP